MNNADTWDIFIFFVRLSDNFFHIQWYSANDTQPATENKKEKKKEKKKKKKKKREKRRRRRRRRKKESVRTYLFRKIDIKWIQDLRIVEKHPQFCKISTFVMNVIHIGILNLCTL